jgi:methionyl-tRNA formyltransferase
LSGPENQSKAMRIVFMGTGEIALPCLHALLESEHEVCGVVTQPDRPVGRHQELHPPAPKVVAEKAGLPVLQPERLRKVEGRADLEALVPDLIVVMAYGQILPPSVLELPKVACINVHASLLPRHRGASCLQAAIAEGDELSGVTIMHMAKGLDTGDVILKKSVPLSPDETGGSLHDRLAELAPEVLLEAVAQLAEGTAARHPQDETQATYAPKLLREDGKIDWGQPADRVSRLIRAYDPWPGTFSRFRDHRGRERRLKIFAGAKPRSGQAAAGEVRVTEEGEVVVGCGQGELVLAEVQAEGSRRMGAAEFAGGHLGPEGGLLF